MALAALAQASTMRCHLWFTKALPPLRCGSLAEIQELLKKWAHGNPILPVNVRPTGIPCLSKIHVTPLCFYEEPT